MSEHTYCGAGLAYCGKTNAKGDEWVCYTCGRLYRLTLIIENTPVWTEVRGPILPDGHNDDDDMSWGAESQPASPRRHNRGDTSHGE